MDTTSAPVSDLYSPQFFADIAGESERSANVIVPKFNDLVKPSSVIDVGCGKGWFLAKFIEEGVADALGVDGSPPKDLVIPRDCYRQVDLTAPPSLERFDLAVCLEVAEHLPEPAATGFVAFLCDLAPVVLFSAAIPMQGGQGHINERWPDYWIPHFASHGFRASGWPRLDIWNDERVAPYYRQNLLLFVHEAHSSYELKHYVDSSPSHSLERFVHPEILGQKLGVKFK